MGLHMAQWEEARAKLASLPVGPERDDYIDELVDQAMRTLPGDPDVAAFCIEALPLVQRALTLRSTALALALLANPEEITAVDILVEAFRQHRMDVFLAPALLDSLALLAERSSIARAETASALIRLTCRDSRYLLIKGAQIISRLVSFRKSPDFRQKLHELGACSDLGVQAEVVTQEAFIELADALLSSSAIELYQRLEQAQAMFERAGRMEEHRPDAELFANLVEMLLDFHKFTTDQDRTVQRLQDLMHYLRNVLVTRWWSSYRSEWADVCVARVLEIADALQRAIVLMQGAEDWTNLDEALTELAALYAVICSQQGADASHLSFSVFADTVFVPQLGPVLQAAVGRRRLAKVSDNYVATHGEDEFASGLRAFLRVVTALEEQQSKGAQYYAVPPDLSLQLLQLASARGQSPEMMVQSFLRANRQGIDAIWMQEWGLGSVEISVDRPEMFGGSSSVNEVTVDLLRELKKYLDPYPPLKWQRLMTVVETIASFAKYVFDTLPAWTKCQEDGGLGQKASEKDLQWALFSWLRQRFEDNVVYEFTPLGGGRVDSGLQFPECRIPIEIKHEFTSISPEHVREHYLLQADIYAASTDRVSFLLILDLRNLHAQKHRTRKSKTHQVEEKAEMVSLYSWQEGFWVDSLPVDPQVPQARPKAIVICAIPGNRPTPSSTTLYSSRPSQKHKKSDVSNIIHDNQG
jgi:hypothetical protein